MLNRSICKIMMPCIISGDEAVERTINFLQQHYSIAKIEKPVLKEDAWIVEVVVSEPQQKKFQVKINSRTGSVLGF